MYKYKINNMSSYTITQLYSEEYSDRDCIYRATIILQISLDTKSVILEFETGMYEPDKFLINGTLVTYDEFINAPLVNGVGIFDKAMFVAAIERATAIEISVDGGHMSYLSDFFWLVSDKNNIPPESNNGPSRSMINPKYFTRKLDEFISIAINNF